MLLKQALALHQGGQVAPARDIYYRLLRDVPRNADVLRLLGTAESQLGRPEEGVRLLGESLTAVPNQPDAHHNRANILQSLQRFDEAVVGYDKALALRPDFVEAWFSRGNALRALGRIGEAAVSYNRALALRPGFADAWLNLGAVLLEGGQAEAGLASFDKALAINPHHIEALNNRGNALRDLKRFDEAISTYDRLLEIRPDLPEVHNNRGNALLELERRDEALAGYDRALALRPAYAEALNNRANILKRFERFDEALANNGQALALAPGFANAWLGRGDILQAMDRHEEAVTAYDRALALQPAMATAHNNRGSALHTLGRLEEALASHDRAAVEQPDFAEAHYGRGSVLQALDRPDEALESYDRAIALKADLAEAYNDRATILQALNRYPEAIADYDKALTFKPDFAKSWNNLGNAKMMLSRFDDALADYRQALKIDPDCDWLPGIALHLEMQLAEWADFDNKLQSLLAAAGEARVSAPLPLQALTDSPEQLLKSTALFTSAVYPADRFLPDLPPVPAHDRIRIGYFSSDYGDHPVSHLLAGMFEHHDRTKFEIYAFALRPENTDSWWSRIAGSVDRLVNVSSLPDHKAAAMARDMQIDIAIDLNGMTSGCRTGIFAERIAPVQASYIGYLGTMGAPYYDYLIADATLVPESSRSFYAEKLAYLPSYQMNDDSQAVSGTVFSRAALGLPDEGVVFCAFNQIYKVTPEVFGAWMRILKRVPGSVLWLVTGNATAKANLRREAEQRGIDPGRLVFAERMPLEDHLARLRQANLFLDTHPYNAGATASNALRMGVPVLTRIGRTFAARMGASLLTAAGLPELITETAEDYENLAVALATDSERLADVRQRLAENLPKGRLFNTEAATRDMERLYEAMYRRHRDGLPPEHLQV